ncbi:MAG: sulfite exporter TauE/SafE family protein [Archangium sp.]|nr:sulfite exporter TauE/SafE family protein [Archangium sp.]
MEPMLASAGALSALVAGATGSLHCALMCGPLACAGLPASGPDRRRAAISWHLGRIAAYSFVGLLLGALGRGVSQGLMVSVQPVLPWVMAAGLVITALDLAKHVRPIPGVAGISRALARAGATMQPATRSFLLGAATPFLPCGLLYGLFLAAIATGTPWGGAAVLGAFSLGAIPALGAVQLGTQLSTSPRLALIARRVVPLVAAAVLVVRALMTRADPAKCG